MTRLDKSREWWARAERVIPMGTQTLSKSPTQFVQGVSPIYLERGKGSHVWDVDGNEYVDYPMALGPVLLGYAEPAVDDAIRAQLEDGITFTLMHPLEVEVAERIVAMCPGVDAVRFGKTGSDALSAAVRAARAVTGRERVLVSGYHGWHDWYIGSTTRSRGVPKTVQDLVSTFPFNDLGALQRLLEPGDVAAVIVEPSGAELPSPDFLRGAVGAARSAGAVSIFDEIITGFRVAPGGARTRYGVQPDVSCYGKAMGNGMPISAVAGTWDVMNVFEDVFFSGTHGGEALSLAAAKVVLDTVEDGSVLAEIEQRGQRLRDGVQARIDARGVGDAVRLSGEPHRTVVSFPDDTDLLVKSWVQQTLVEHGILFNGSMFLCARHTDEDIDRAVAAFDAAFEGIQRGDDLAALLKGPPVKPVFRTP